MMFTPNNYNSLTELRDACIIDAHSDTTFQGVDVFGYFEGNAYGVAYIYEDISESDYAVAGDCIDVKPRAFKINHVDTCSQDYFRGHYLPNFAISVTGLTTYRELLGMCLEWQNTDHLDEELFRDSEDYNAFREAIVELFSLVENMDEIFQPRLDVPETEEERDMWDVCAFFTVEILEEDDEV